MMTGWNMVWLAGAGGLGALSRWLLAGVVQRVAGGRFPWGTLCVNATGCFLFGLVWALAEERRWIPPTARTVALTGFFGAFTTFSTYAFETVDLVQGGHLVTALVNFTAHNLLGVFAVLGGLALGRLA